MTGAVTFHEEDAAHCQALVRDRDKDRYLATLFAPQEKRPQLMALYAFNAEVARIRYIVSEPMLGEMRMQWWAESIEALYAGRTADHPVLRMLAVTIEESGLPKQPFLDLIDARRSDLYADLMPTLRALEGYAGETTSAVIQMAAVILIGTEASRVVDAAGHGGVAQAIVRLLRQVRGDRQAGRVAIPEDILLEHGLKASDYLAGRWSDAMRLAFARVRYAARKHLSEARAYDPDVPLDALAAFLPLALCDLYLRRMEGSGFNAFTMSPEVSQLRRQWRLLLASWRAAY